MTTYNGSCHCGAVKFTVEADLDNPVLACNCSMCGRAGTLLTFVPDDKFTLVSGDDNLTDYQFNKNVIHHLFCKTCGIKSFAWGTKDGHKMRAVNARALEGVDPEKLQIKHVDGKSA
ncbi:MAG TPA: GFA family protein [Kofleriaceae bacterium]|jgi:hypothetical protein